MKTVFRFLLQVLFRFRACDPDALTGSTGYNPQWRVLWNGCEPNAALVANRLAHASRQYSQLAATQTRKPIQYNYTRRMATYSTAKHVDFLDHFRGIAIIAVLLFHIIWLGY
jgi:hypothetical protein